MTTLFLRYNDTDRAVYMYALTEASETAVSVLELVGGAV